MCIFYAINLGRIYFCIIFASKIRNRCKHLNRKMKTLLLSALLFLFARNATVQDTTVYISTGSSAYAYHARLSCQSLKRCKEEGHVKAVSLEKAISMGRKPCKFCYK